MVNVYVVCREGNPFYEKYLQNLSGDQVRVVGFYLTPERLRNDCSQYVLGHALANADLLETNLILCESSLCNTTNINVSHKMGMRVVDLEMLFAGQINKFLNNKSVAEGFRWLARKIAEAQETREIIIFSTELFDAPLGGLDGQLEYGRTPSKINTAWVYDQLNRVFPVVSKEIVSDPDFFEGRFSGLQATTLLLTGGRIWDRKRNNTSARFFPLPFSAASVELVLVNPLAFDYSLDQLRADIVSFSEYPLKK